MTRLVGAELLKIRTTRGAWGFLAALLAIVVIGIAGTVGGAPDPALNDTLVEDTLAIAASASVFALLAGVIGFTSEFRHGTVTQTFLVEPVRERVLAAKLVAYALLGLLFAAASVAVTLAIAAPWLDARGAQLDLGERERLLVLAGGLASTVLWGALGVSVGAVIRNQVVAVVGVLVWILIVENLVSAFLDEIGPYLPGRASSAMVGSSFMEDDLSRAGGTLVSLLYVAGVSALAAVLLRRQDVS
jgi:ABC-type transport system involved in multi-copper enzyme maturation permease subunit